MGANIHRTPGGTLACGVCGYCPGLIGVGVANAERERSNRQRLRVSCTACRTTHRQGGSKLPERFVGCLRRFGTKQEEARWLEEETINTVRELAMWFAPAALFLVGRTGGPPSLRHGGSTQRIYSNAGMPRSTTQGTAYPGGIRVEKCALESLALSVCAGSPRALRL